MRRSLTFALACLLGCKGGSSTAPGDSENPYGLTGRGPVPLTVFPLDLSTVYSISPLGKMAPPGHVLPTDHIYIAFVDAFGGNQQNNDCSARQVRAAADGVVDFTLVTESGGDTKVDVQVNATFHYYYDHVLLRPGVALGTRVHAGDTIATTTGRCPSMDLGVWDSGLTPSNFVNPARYAGQTLHVLPPLKQFNEPLRSALYAKVLVFEGVPSDKDGRIDTGVAGRLAGDWFHSSIASADASQTMGPAGWPKSLSFSPDYFNQRPLLSIGGTVAPAMITPLPPSVDPTTWSVSSGRLAFATAAYNGLYQPGWILAQLIAADRLRIEFFAGATAQPSGFTSAAQDYVR